MVVCRYTWSANVFHIDAQRYINICISYPDWNLLSGQRMPHTSTAFTKAEKAPLGECLQFLYGHLFCIIVVIEKFDFYPGSHALSVHYHCSAIRYCSCFDICRISEWPGGRYRWFIVCQGHYGWSLPPGIDRQSVRAFSNVWTHALLSCLSPTHGQGRGFIKG